MASLLAIHHVVTTVAHYQADFIMQVVIMKNAHAVTNNY